MKFSIPEGVLAFFKTLGFQGSRRWRCDAKILAMRILAAEILCDAFPRCKNSSDAMPRFRPLSLVHSAVASPPDELSDCVRLQPLLSYPLLRHPEAANQSPMIAIIELVQGAPPRGRQLYFAFKCSKPFIRSVKSTLSHLKSCNPVGHPFKHRLILSEYVNGPNELSCCGKKNPE